MTSERGGFLSIVEEPDPDDSEDEGGRGGGASGVIHEPRKLSATPQGRLVPAALVEALESKEGTREAGTPASRLAAERSRASAKRAFHDEEAATLGASTKAADEEAAQPRGDKAHPTGAGVAEADEVQRARGAMPRLDFSALKQPGAAVVTHASFQQMKQASAGVGAVGVGAVAPPRVAESTAAIKKVALTASEAALLVYPGDPVEHPWAVRGALYHGSTGPHLSERRERESALPVQEFVTASTRTARAL